MEKHRLLPGARHIRVNQKAIHFGVNVLDGYLKPIKALNFLAINSLHEIIGQVFIHNAVTACKKCQDVFDEESLIVAQLLPVSWVVTKGLVAMMGYKVYFDEKDAGEFSSKVNSG